MTSTQHREIARQVRDECIQAALSAYEDASISGLCAEGAFEAAVSAMRMLDAGQLAEQAAQPAAQPAAQTAAQPAAKESDR